MQLEDPNTVACAVSEVMPFRNHLLDSLRGLAAIAVVFFHLNETIPYEDNAYRIAAKYGWLGVIVFFVLSGYCVQLAASRSRSVADFYWRRFCRIYPPYLASLVVVALVSLSRKWWIGVNDVAVWPAGASQWLATLAIMVKPATSVAGVNWVYWSLSYEVAFYAVLGLTLVHRRLLLPLMLGVTGLSAIPMLQETPGLFFLSHWCLFSLGVGLFELCAGKTRSGALIVLSAAVIAYFRLSSEALAAVALTSLAIGCSSRRWGRFLTRATVISRVGEWSYGLYLLHVPIGCYLLLRLREGVWLKNPWYHACYDTGVVLICIGLSAVFFRIVEMPAIALGRFTFPWARKKYSPNEYGRCLAMDSPMRSA